VLTSFIPPGTPKVNRWKEGMKNFELYEPETLREACALLEKFNGKAKVLAGGTDLLVQLKTDSIKVPAVINLKKIKGLDKIIFHQKHGLRIGALVTWAQLLDSEPVQAYYPVLRKAAETMGSLQIRNLATLAGNICHASPAANGPIPLLLYEAECMVQCPKGERSIPIEKMFVGVQESSLQRGEIVVEINLPLSLFGMKGTYYKFSTRRAMDLAIVGVGVLVKTSNGTFDEVRIALGAVASTPIRARQAERVLVGETIDDLLIQEAAEIASGECSPVPDIRASKEYRIELVKELTYRAIKDSVA
jgi:CO/xanthine dehydrogenase FAD-binding subunit